MATSNGWNEAQKSWFWNGTKVTADRYRYELSRQQETTLKQVNDLISRQAADVVAPAAGFDQQQFGGLLRQVVPTLLDQYGKINATAAIQFYDQSREFWDQNLSNASQGGRDARRTAAQRYATARTQGAVKAAQGYAAQFADTYDTVSKTDAVVNWAMKVRATSGHQPSVEAMQNALTREVAAYHRDTVLFNSALDPNVSRVQRVAQASACEFCRLMALGSTNGKVRVSTYAVKFHSHCHCTIQPLFDGEQPVRPDYYDQFEKQYAEASKSGGSAKSILKNWRENSKTASVAVEPVKVPKQRTAPKAQAKAVVAPTGPYDASQVGSRVIDPQAPTSKDGWWWTRGYKAKTDKRTLIQENNADILGLRAGKEGAAEGSSRWIARNVPLRAAAEDLKVLEKPELRLDSIEKTNPKYDATKSAYSSNCARVISAYELRRRGFDVTASKYAASDSSQSSLMFGRYWKNEKTGKTVYDELEDRGTKLDNGQWSKRSYSGFTTYDDYLERLAADYPPGSRGIIQVQWSKSKIGHVFSFEIKDGGGVVMLDAQTGKTGRELEDYFKRGVLWKTARMDDKEPMSGVLQYLEGFQ